MTILKTIVGVLLCLISIPLLILYVVAFVSSLNIESLGAAIIPGLMAYWGYRLIENDKTEKEELTPQNV